MAWNEVIDTVTVLTLARENFPPAPELPEGFRFTHELDRDVERAMLEPVFAAWHIPFERRMPGSREDSMLAILEGEKPVALGYMCTENEFGIADHGQGHYVVVDPEYRGKRLYQYLYAGLLVKAADFGLPGIVITTDRQGLAEVYERWGGVIVRRVPKADLAHERAEKAAREQPTGLRGMAAKARRALSDR